MQVTLFSRHASLLDLSTTRQGRIVIVHFKFDTKDAAGQNMVTSSTWHSCKWLLRKIEKDLPSIRIINFWIESNMSGDKKTAFMNMMRTRGLHVQAETWVPESILRSVLKVCYCMLKDLTSNFGFPSQAKPLSLWVVLTS